MYTTVPHLQTQLLQIEDMTFQSDTLMQKAEYRNCYTVEAHESAFTEVLFSINYGNIKKSAAGHNYLQHEVITDTTMPL